MDELDCRILQLLQDEFPLEQKPYDILSGKLGLSCEQLLARVQKLIEDGVIRRLGASLDSRKFGFCSTLAAVSVAADMVERAAEVIGGFPEVTHSYLRKDSFNIWFTVIAVDEKRIEQVLEEIRMALKISDSQIINLPMKQLFKLDARFNMSN